MTSTQVWPILSDKLTGKSHGMFALKGFYARSLLIMHFVLSEYYSIHNKGQSWHFMNDSSPLAWLKLSVLGMTHSMNQYLALAGGGREQLLLRVALIQPSATVAFHLQITERQRLPNMGILKVLQKTIWNKMDRRFHRCHVTNIDLMRRS